MSDVLIVDDCAADRAAFGAVLRRGGFRVHELGTGGEALEAAAALRPHVVIVDIRLPDIDGRRVCRALRDDPMIGGIPILMLTDRGDWEDVREGFEAGADDFVAKDSSPEVILARVRRLARYREMANTAILNEQMAQIGRLLAGIVHEIRGPISVIRGNAELMKLRLGPGDPALEFADPIIRGTQLLQVRLEHLMATVRNGPNQLLPLDLTTLAREAVEYFRKGADPRQGLVRLLAELDEPTPRVLADAGRLLQVLLNLLANARDAILADRPEGTIRVRVECRGGPDPQGGAPGVALLVLDDGPGVPDELMARIFEPFFTTKEAGTGYGLYLAAQILREHGGRLSARNRPEGGACFSLWLPVEATAAAE